jgi:hypothetical protein
MRMGVDFFLSEARDREVAKLFLKQVLANADNCPPHVFARDGLATAGRGSLTPALPPANPSILQ